MIENKQDSWRRKRDSNPRNPFEFNGFQDRRFQPLTHSSDSYPTRFTATRIMAIAVAFVITSGSTHGLGTAPDAESSSPATSVVIENNSGDLSSSSVMHWIILRGNTYWAVRHRVGSAIPQVRWRGRAQRNPPESYSG